jgi:hypothetical protein
MGKEEIAYDTFRMKHNENASNVFSQNLELEYPPEKRIVSENEYDINNNNQYLENQKLQNNYSTNQNFEVEQGIDENDEYTENIQYNNLNEDGNVEIFEDIENHVEEINDIELEEHQNNKDEL